MKILETYTRLITETQIQACIKKFGHELFGHELGTKEKNTGIENSYVRDIQDFTDSKYGGRITHDFLNAMHTLKGCVKQYPEVLIPEKTKVYRGLTIPAKYFIDSKTPINIHKPFQYTYKATSKIQSWSTNFDSASLFGNQDSLNDTAKGLKLEDYQTPEARKHLLSQVVADGLKMAFVLEYTTNPTEYLFKSEYFRIISQAYHEDELIRIDNKPIHVIAKFNDHVDVFQTYKGIQLIRLINLAIQES